ncbi:MAG: DUF3067 family protein [Cyanobacteria bacterium J06597_16]
MTGQDLHTLLVEKWGYSYDVQLRKLPRKVFFQVMWRYVEQASFPMSEADYMAHLDDVVAYLNAWGAAEQIQSFIEQTSERPRLGKAVSIPVDLGSRASEWLLDDN